ncbi:MAG: LysR family glycine cleavage system transcriptional activator [Myxococcota bacterium]|jgi:LysR family glycine cleavage system transcriptional activator
MIRLGGVPTNDNLVCFLAAAEHLNFRRAASIVALTPTAFGQRIKQLEEQLGVPLFERTTRNVALTSAGAALIEPARNTLEQARRCLEAVHDEAPPVSFVLGSRYELAQSWLAPTIAGLTDSRPNWHINMYCGSGEDIIARLRAGDVDCIVTSAPMARSGWTVEVLHPETYSFVAAPELLARLPLVTESDCRFHTLIDIDRSLPLARYLTGAEGELLTFAEERYMGSGGAMLELLRGGHGVAVLPDYMMEQDLADKRLLRVLTHRQLLTDTFRLIYKTNAPLASVYTELARQLRKRSLT